jgi:hypothetical protein
MGSEGLDPATLKKVINSIEALRGADLELAGFNGNCHHVSYSRYWHLQSADTVRLPAHSRSAATFSAITTANGRVLCISRAIMAALTG